MHFFAQKSNQKQQKPNLIFPSVSLSICRLWKTEAFTTRKIFEMSHIFVVYILFIFVCSSQAAIASE